MKKLALIKIDSEEQTMELGIVSGEELTQYTGIRSQADERNGSARCID